MVGTGNEVSLQSSKPVCSVNFHMGERVLLSKELREEFFETAKSLLRLNSGRQVSKKVGINYSNFKQYKRGERTIPISDFEKLAAPLTKIQKQKFLSNAKFLNSNWGAVKGGKKGIAVVRERYGEEYLDELRKRGRAASLLSDRSLINPPREITIPSKVTPEIAELVGAYLGDGTLTKYFMRIFGSTKWDRNYLVHLGKLIERNFEFKTVITDHKNKNLSDLRMSSKNFVDYFKTEFGFKLGDKIRNKVMIPDFILEDPELAKNCLRGLIDTDGSCCKRGTQMCLDFTSHNPLLLNQVFELGSNLGYFSYKAKKSIGSNSWPRIQKYFSEVGSSNLKHIIRFEERLKNGKLLYIRDTLKYFPKYQDLTLPYLSK